MSDDEAPSLSSSYPQVDNIERRTRSAFAPTGTPTQAAMDVDTLLDVIQHMDADFAQALHNEQAPAGPKVVQYIGSGPTVVRVDCLASGQPRPYADSQYVYRATVECWHRVDAAWVTRVVVAATGHSTVERGSPAALANWSAEYLDYCQQVGDEEVLVVAVGNPPRPASEGTPCYWRSVWELRWVRAYTD